MIKTTCGFTGHRPAKLPWRHDEHDPTCIAFRETLKETVVDLIRSGTRRFICGMAEGCDTLFAETILALRDDYTYLTLEAALPCDNQTMWWDLEHIQRYNYIISQCDDIHVTSHQYTIDCMWLRNKYLVNQSDILLAATNGMNYGGTAQTIQYAKKMGVPIIEIDVTLPSLI